MSLTIWTHDWVPGGENGPRGFVRDLRLRWALEEAGLRYSVRTTPFENRGPEHFRRQPFGQVPFLTDGDLTIFESGACLLHLAGKSDKLMPSDPAGVAETTQWVVAALNSIEMVSVPWWLLTSSGDKDNALTDWLGKRLSQLEDVLRDREWLVASRFTVADILMADVLRIPDVRTFAASPVIEPISIGLAVASRSERRWLIRSRILQRRMRTIGARSVGTALRSFPGGPRCRVGPALRSGRAATAAPAALAGVVASFSIPQRMVSRFQMGLH